VNPAPSEAICKFRVSNELKTEYGNNPTEFLTPRRKEKTLRRCAAA